MTESESGITNQRLSRIEDKVDKLTQVVTSLAIMEERTSNQQTQIAKMEADIVRAHTRLDGVENCLSVYEGGRKAFIWIGGSGLTILGFLVGHLSNIPIPPIT